MVRIARAVVPGIRHHITQRGNRHKIEVWVYCLMPNHVLYVAPHNTCSSKTGYHSRYSITLRRFLQYVTSLLDESPEQI